MKILFATMQFGEGYYQGTEKYLTNLGNGLIAAGHEVIYLAGDPEKKRKKTFSLGDRVASHPTILHYPSYGWMAVIGEKKTQLKQLLSTIKPDIVHLINPGHIGINIIFAAKELNIPTVISIVDFWWLCPKQTLIGANNKLCDGNQNIKTCMQCIVNTDSRKIIHKISQLSIIIPALFYFKGIFDSSSLSKTKQWFQRLQHISKCLKQTDSIITLSKTGYKLINEQFNINKITYIPIGLDKRWLQDSIIKTIEENLIIGFAGTLAPHKGVHLLLEAIKLLGWTKSRINIAGTGIDLKYKTYLEKLAQGLNVKFFGKVEAHCMPDFINQNHLLIVPSIWPENQPQIILESFSQQVPVIGSDMPGIAELIKDSDNIFETGSAYQLAQKLKNWFENPQQLPIPKPCSINTMTNKTLSVYNDIL